MINCSCYRDSRMLAVNHSCIVDQASQFCLGSTASCFHLADSQSDDCKPNGKAVYIKCGMFLIQYY